MENESPKKVNAAAITLGLMLLASVSISSYLIYNMNEEIEHLTYVWSENEDQVKGLREELETKNEEAQISADSILTLEGQLSNLQIQYDETTEELTEQVTTLQEELDSTKEALAAAEDQLMKQIADNEYLKQNQPAQNEPVVFSSYSTNYKTGGGRGENIRIATEAINGKVLQPGGVLSFNRCTGYRTPDNGYQLAHVLVGGQYVNGYGGGVCQVSSTLFNAALEAGLGVEERHNHSLKSAYVPAGRDATVADNGLDLQIKNTLDIPVIIQAATNGGVCTVNVIADAGTTKPSVSVSVDKQSTHTYKLTQTVNGNVNYTCKSVYKN